MLETLVHDHDAIAANFVGSDARTELIWHMFRSVSSSGTNALFSASSRETSV